VLLLDQSIRTGDVISVSGTYGWVTALGGRYVSVVTRDGVEHLIPNETLISERVENWTHTNSHTRLKIPVRVAYETDCAPGDRPLRASCLRDGARAGRAGVPMLASRASATTASTSRSGSGSATRTTVSRT
jgi:hypothetical protein